METVDVPPESGLIGRTLAELAPTERVGVQVAGIKRAGVRLLNLGGDEKLFAGDEVLLLGTATQIQAFERWLIEPPQGQAR
jgi:CPA2 family monovalent cation:H+ antiporter-2